MYLQSIVDRHCDKVTFCTDTWTDLYPEMKNMRDPAYDLLCVLDYMSEKDVFRMRLFVSHISNNDDVHSWARENVELRSVLDNAF